MNPETMYISKTPQFTLISIFWFLIWKNFCSPIRWCRAQSFFSFALWLQLQFQIFVASHKYTLNKQIPLKNGDFMWNMNCRQIADSTFIQNLDRLIVLQNISFLFGALVPYESLPTTTTIKRCYLFCIVFCMNLRKVVSYYFLNQHNTRQIKSDECTRVWKTERIVSYFFQWIATFFSRKKFYEKQQK